MASADEKLSVPNVGPYSEQLGIDPVVHEPARLIILMILDVAVGKCDFRFLEKHTGQSPGNLSAQTIKLEQAGYISIKKSFLGKHPATEYRITSKGRKALTAYWQQMEAWKQSKTLDKIEEEKARLNKGKQTSPGTLPSSS
jgi:DNA-binding HxlR family transcriptional regulator